MGEDVRTWAVIAGVQIGFVTVTLLAAWLLTYLLGVMSFGVVVATWAITTVSVSVLARLLSRVFVSQR